jgi:hypothetical protein
MSVRRGRTSTIVATKEFREFKDRVQGYKLKNAKEQL